MRMPTDNNLAVISKVVPAKKRSCVEAAGFSGTEDSCVFSTLIIQFRTADQGLPGEWLQVRPETDDSTLGTAVALVSGDVNRQRKEPSHVCHLHHPASD